MVLLAIATIPLANLLVYVSQRPIEGGIVTTGVVTGEYTETTGTGDDESTTRYVTIEYRDAYEARHTMEESYFGGVAVGDEVKVRYDPDHPSRAQWVDKPYEWVTWVLLGVFDTIWLVLVVLTVKTARDWRAWKQRQPAALR